MSSVNLITLNGLESLQCDGDPDIVLDLIQTFLSDIPGRMQAIDKGLAESNFKTVRENAHTAKSGARMLGAAALGELCQALEDLPDDRSRFAEGVHALKSELAKVIWELNAAAAERSARAAG